MNFFLKKEDYFNFKLNSKKIKLTQFKIQIMKHKFIFIFVFFTFCIYFTFESCEKDDDGVMIIPSPPSQPSNT